MSWFSRGRSARPRELEGLESGEHRSPGLEALAAILDERPSTDVCDLGPPSTDNLEFFSRWHGDVAIQDLFRSCGPEAAAAAFHFRQVDDLPLPTEERYGALIAWDLLHYFERGDLARFGRRLAALCRPQALVFVMFTATEPVPPVPINFRILARDRLHYEVPAGGRRDGGRQLSLREVEKALAGFAPLRVFQLRNGVQECLFRWVEPPAE